MRGSEYYLKNKDRIKAASAAYYLQNKDKINSGKRENPPRIILPFEAEWLAQHDWNKLPKSSKVRRQLNRDFVRGYLAQHPCVDCGEGDPIVLEFDHVRDAKIDSVSALVANPTALNTVVAEIEKCEVRCANCHRRKTVMTHNHYKGRI